MGCLIDEDIPTITPSPIDTEELPVAAKNKSNDEIRIGPITRARAKLLEQQVNSLLVENAIYFGENFILPKSLCLCVIRYIEDEGMARGSEEMQHMEHGVMIVEACAREEREEGARGEDHQDNQAEVVQPTVARPDICNYPARTIRPPDYPASQEGRQVSARSPTPRWSDRIFPIIRPGLSGHRFRPDYPA